MSKQENTPIGQYAETSSARTYEMIPDNALRQFMEQFESKLSESEGKYLYSGTLTTMLGREKGMSGLPNIRISGLYAHLRGTSTIPMYRFHDVSKTTYAVDTDGARAVAAFTHTLQNRPVHRSRYENLARDTRKRLGEDPLTTIIYEPSKKKDETRITDIFPEGYEVHLFGNEISEGTKSKEKRVIERLGPIEKVPAISDDVVEQVLAKWNAAAVQAKIASIPQSVSLEQVSFKQIPYSLIQTARFVNAVASNQLDTFSPQDPNITYRDVQSILQTFQVVLEYYEGSTAADIYKGFKAHVANLSSGNTQ
jgi:hypothetical protein